MDERLREIFDNMDADALAEWLDQWQLKIKSLEGQFLALEFDMRALRRKLPD